jgi:hypothetical protein
MLRVHIVEHCSIASTAPSPLRRRLTEIKGRNRVPGIILPSTEEPMPRDVAITVTIVTFAFIAFAGVLYWAEAQTRDLKR